MVEGERDVVRVEDSLPDAQVDAVVSATVAIGGVITHSVSPVDPALTMPQWRMLPMAAAAGHRLIDASMARRRELTAGIMARMTAEQRDELARSMGAFDGAFSQEMGVSTAASL